MKRGAFLIRHSEFGMRNCGRNGKEWDCVGALYAYMRKKMLFWQKKLRKIRVKGLIFFVIYIKMNYGELRYVFFARPK